ncbi:hypothetical protein U1Q18_033393 [Sarracenia purpurea var. burkii]
MEISNDDGNNGSRKAKSKSILPAAKPPTRLQKQAPAALHLDQFAVSGNIDNSNYPSSSTETFSRCAIPLLSPLVVSPIPSKERERKQSTAIAGSGCGDDESSQGSDGSTITPTQSSGWQHPAAEALPDASSLVNLFQSQFLLVHHAQ